MPPHRSKRASSSARQYKAEHRAVQPSARPDRVASVGVLWCVSDTRDASDTRLVAPLGLRHTRFESPLRAFRFQEGVVRKRQNPSHGSRAPFEQFEGGIHDRRVRHSAASSSWPHHSRLAARSRDRGVAEHRFVLRVGTTRRRSRRSSSPLAIAKRTSRPRRSRSRHSRARSSSCAASRTSKTSAL